MKPLLNTTLLFLLVIGCEQDASEERFTISASLALLISDCK